VADEAARSSSSSWLVVSPFGDGQSDAAVPPEGSNGSALLEVRQVSKRFGGVSALVGVSLQVGAGEVVGLVGPNGAGKTTLFNCICGQLRLDEGSVWFDGRRIDRMPVHRRARLGIGRTFQRVEVFPEMTPIEHALVGRRAMRGNPSVLKDLAGLDRPSDEDLRVAEEVVARLGLGDVADRPVASLSLGHLRLVELARAIAASPRLVLADEPSSGLDVHETAALGEALRELASRQGVAVLLVEHDLGLVRQVADRVVVMDFGHVLATGPYDQVLANPEVRRAYLGKIA
jgi:branched-chain amino acid transport system ATP-binding protein